jgi:hypothetical protein
MALNIKDEETYNLVKQLAALKGASLTSVVKEAVREVLEREKSHLEERNGKSRFEILTEFSALTAPLFTDGRTANELINELYDEATGLRK